MAAVTKTVFLSLVSRTSFLNSTAPLSSSSSTPSTSDTDFNATTSVTASNAGLACNAQSISWSSASTSWRDASEYQVTFTTTTEYDTSTFVTGLYTCTSSCGSSPGAISYCGPSTAVYNTTHISTAHVTSTWTWPSFPTPEPNCTVPTSDCLALSTSYSSSLETYFSVPWESQSLVQSPESPRCCVKTACTFDYGAVDFYFFPMTATKNLTRNMCTDGPEGGWENSVTTSPDPDSTYVEVTTGAYTVVNGNTMYEGNVYLSLSDPWVRDNCYNTVKPQTVKPRIVTMASSDVFSVRGYPHNVIPYSMNYADFIEPVPWSAYLGGRYCYANRVACTQVFPGDYYPVIRMPGQIRHLDPNWASCEFTEFPLFDPPIALTAVPNFLTSSSTPADPTPTSAEPVVTATPGQSSNDESPPVTSTPKPTSRPADPEDPVSSPTLQDPPPSQTQSPEDPEPGETQTPSDPQEPVPSNGNTPNPQEPIPSNGNTPDPQEPLPSNGNNPDPQEPLPSNGNNPEPQEPLPSNGNTPDPQEPIPSNGNTPGPQEPVPSNNPDPLNPTPINPQIPNPVNPTPGGPEESGPGNPNTRDPNDPSEPSADPSATLSPNDPQNPSSPSNSPNPVPGEDITAGPGSNPTAGPGSNPTAGPGSNPGSNPGNSQGNNGQSNPTAPVITVGPTVIPVDPTGGLIINPGTTLTNGGAPVVISSTTFSIGTGGLTIVSPETSTEVQFGDGPVTVPVGPSGVPIVLDPSASTIVIGGTTLSQGGDPVTVGDSTLSVGLSGVVIAGPSGTSTIDIPVATTTGTSTSAGTKESPSGQVDFDGAAVQIVGNYALAMGMVALWLAVI